MSSIIVAGDTSGTITLQAPAVAGTTTLTFPSTSGTVVTDATSTGINASALSTGTVGTARLGSGTADSTTYLRGDQTWATVSAGGITLLGSITTSTSNSISLGSLTLTSYKSLMISLTSVSVPNNYIYISSSNVQSGGGIQQVGVAATISGVAWIDLTSGSIGGTAGENTISGNGFILGGLTNVTTSSTTIYFRCGSTSTFTGTGGTIRIYGVK